MDMIRNEESLTQRTEIEADYNNYYLDIGNAKVEHY